MKSFIFLSVFGLIISFAFSVSATAQTPQVPSKIGWIDTSSFSDEKAGVTKFVNALKGVDEGFKPKVSELEGIQGKIKTIADELQKTSVPMDLQAKREEGERLQREFEFKKKEFEASYNKRRNEVIGPITADIMKVMQDFAKQKGYVAILDIGSLAQANALLVLEPSADVTKEFIAFYNGRPAGAATAERK